jgi:hypothetical protein
LVSPLPRDFNASLLASLVSRLGKRRLRFSVHLSHLHRKFFKRDGAELRARNAREKARRRLACRSAILRNDSVRLFDQVADERGPITADRWEISAVSMGFSSGKK